MVRFGIIGCGGISEWHINAINDAPNAELCAVCDMNDAAAKAWGEKYGVDAFNNAEEMFGSGLIDAVSICTPSGTHASLAISALNNGINAVVEKPMAITKESLNDLLKAEKESSARLFPISQLRCMPDINKAKKIIEEGKLGKLTLMDLSMKYYRNSEYFSDKSWRGTWKMDGGGAVMNQGIHGVDLLRYLCGEVEGVCAKAKTILQNIETEDSLVACLSFENGGLGVITAGTAAYPGFSRRLEICGTKGSLVLDEGNLVEINIQNEEPYKLTLSDQQNGASNPFAIGYEPHRLQYVNILDAIENNADLIITDKDAAKTLELVFDLYKSANIGE